MLCWCAGSSGGVGCSMCYVGVLGAVVVWGAVCVGVVVV